MAWLDAFLSWVRDVLAMNGVDVEASVLHSLFWLIVASIAVFYGYKAVSAAVDAGFGAGKFVKDQIEQQFWTDPGKLRFVIGLLLLVVAYGFYGGDQSRPLGEALLDIGRGQVLALMPLAITTQWILLIAFWLLLGLVMGVPFAKLGKPIGETALGLALIGAHLVLFTLAVMALADGRVGEGLLWYLAFAVLVLPLLIVGIRQQRASGVRPKPHQSAPVMWLLFTLAMTLLSGLIFGIVAAVQSWGDRTMTLEDALRGDLVAVLVLTLLMGFRFRADILSEAEAPEALLYFIDCSLALAAGVIAVLGAQQAPVTLGQVPTWLLALAPPLIVAVMIYLVRLRKLRADTPRWTACLVTGALAAFLVLPATALLTRLLQPMLPRVDLPFL